MVDEQTTGFHMADLEQSFSVLNWLVEVGNTAIVIEHNLDIVKNDDWVIDLGRKWVLARERSSSKERPLIYSRMKPQLQQCIPGKASTTVKYRFQVNGVPSRVVK
ncbi:hypothetical protein ACFFQF_17565 [Haladaptatus pallidirubidus]|uniref:Excinuclease ABC subunit A n=1 Tax=Haladaptatus pallidirubidus TaxID=1008152 RepID=A0AAV3UR98_9EURY|nr:hypothetical protein [Haladaptatus pallidirubidus]